MTLSARLVVLFLLLACACDKRESVTLKDTEGRSVLFECKKEDCILTQQSGPPAPSDKAVLRLASHGRLVGLCNASDEGADPSAADCRALTCEADANCPPQHGLPQGSCVNGLCVEPANPLISDDAVMMCLAGSGLGVAAPRQVERYAMALNCGSPCKVPAPCRQP